MAKLIVFESRRVFEAIDYKVDPPPPSSPGSPPGETMLVAPTIDPGTPEGRRSRAKLLRAWVEVSSWLTIYHRGRASKSVV